MNVSEGQAVVRKYYALLCPLGKVGCDHITRSIGRMRVINTCQKVIAKAAHLDRPRRGFCYLNTIISNIYDRFYLSMTVVK
jgi:hypothetical protein